jgi:hypothetical protein
VLLNSGELGMDIRKIIVGITLLSLTQASSVFAISPKTELRHLIKDSISELCVIKGRNTSPIAIAIANTAVAKDGSGWVKAGMQSARGKGTFYLNVITKQFTCSEQNWNENWKNLRKAKSVFWVPYNNKLSTEVLNKWNNRAASLEQFIETDNICSYSAAVSSWHNCIGSTVLANGMWWEGKYQRGCPSGKGKILGDFGHIEGVITSSSGYLTGIRGELYLNNVRVMFIEVKDFIIKILC